MARFINYISLLSHHPVCINIIDCWINLFTLCTFNDSLSAIYGWRRDKVYLRYPQELGSSVRYCCFDNDILALRTIVFMCSFYTHRSLKHKKPLGLTVFFVLLGSSVVKAARKMFYNQLFCTKVFRAAITCLQFAFVIFAKRKKRKSCS